MISLADYLGPYAEHPDATVERQSAAEVLLDAVNALLEAAAQAGAYGWLINPKTGSNISGTHNGGFRPHDCPEGSRTSSHKEGRGVDIYDPQNSLDSWLTDEKLIAFGLYREHPDDTQSWCHLTDRAPGSGHRSFHP